jgi:hypothetical protein
MDKPVFVVGPPGSGTTLLRLMLDSHPDLMLARETGFLRSVSAIHHIPFMQGGDTWGDRLGLSADELDRLIERFYDGVFSLAAQRQGARRWGDKTPFHVHFMSEAAQVFPDAQFVGIVRHPGACASSAGRFQLGWASGVRLWSQRTAAMATHGIGLGDRFLLVRYEDLVTDQRDVVAEVLQFLDLPCDDAVLSHHESHSGRMEGGTQAHDPVDTSRMARWRQSVTDRQLAVLDRNTRGISRLFGYDPVLTEPTGPLNPTDGGPRAIGGTALGELAAQRGIDLSHHVQFQNSAPSPAALADELGETYRLGREGKSLRPPYSRLVPRREVSNRRIDRVRRRLARRIAPDRVDLQ